MSFKNLFVSLLIVFMVFEAQANFGARDCDEYYKHNSRDFNGFSYDERRGHPSEYDPGPVGPEKESWLKLFGQVPNYRAIGDHMLIGDDEKFRWMMGPMWYRGRLGRNEVKVFVVGQEGAQDENVTNRAFTGSTGTRMQQFLNHLGVYESYLFLNTFVYTINGQLGEGDNYVALEQGWESPIVQYRHSLFNNMAHMNPDSLRLMVAVGSGAKRSLATWINFRSGNQKCESGALRNCDLTNFIKSFKDEGVNLASDIKAVGVQHPGGASERNGGRGALSRIIRSFERAAEISATVNIEPDPQEALFGHCNLAGSFPYRLNREYRYNYAPVPFKDFAFGTNWRSGNRGTTSNRNGSDKILVFGEKGLYNPPWRDMHFEDFTSPREANEQLRDRNRGLIFGMKDNEVPYEHPRYSDWGETDGDLAHVQQFDAGPKPEMAQALMDWPDFKLIDESAYAADPAFGFQSIYRGNLENPQLVILADQMGHTRFFAGRAMVGTAGQRLQTFLSKMGLEPENGSPAKYLILNPLPVDTVGVEVDKQIALATTQRNGKSAAKTIQAILSQLNPGFQLAVMGPVSQAVANEMGLKAISMDQPHEDYTHTSQWASVSAQLGQSVSARELEAMSVIPRSDLPYSTRWWMGSSGDRATRGEDSARVQDITGNYYRLEAPWWIRRLSYNPMVPAELEAANNALCAENVAPVGVSCQ